MVTYLFWEFIYFSIFGGLTLQIAKLLIPSQSVEERKEKLLILSQSVEKRKEKLLNPSQDVEKRICVNFLSIRKIFS